MTKRTRDSIIGFAAAALICGPAFAGKEAPVELDQVPANVMDVAKVAFADLKLAQQSDAVVIDEDNIIDDNLVAQYIALGPVTVVSANTETEADGSFVYEIQGTVEGGRKVEVDIYPDGRIEEIEIEFEIDDVPGAVMKAVEKAYPGFKPEFIEASHSRSMQVVGYEFVGMAGENKIDIEVSADGRRIAEADQ